jgi:putative addiction module component (TIGR02574 family)
MSIMTNGKVGRLDTSPTLQMPTAQHSGKVVYMSKKEIIAELPKLTSNDRQEILDKIWELDGGNWLDSGELTTDERLLIEQRLTEHEKNPEDAIPWEEVEARTRRRFNA